MTKFIRSVDKNYIEVSGERKFETDKAILFFDGRIEVWIPKRYIEDTVKDGKNMITITIPEWLAEEKELI